MKGSIKTGLSLLLLLLMLLLASWLGVPVMWLTGGDLNALPFAIPFPVQSIIGVVIIVLVFVPIYLVLCACIYQWSLMPIVNLFGRFPGKRTGSAPE